MDELPDKGCLVVAGDFSALDEQIGKGTAGLERLSLNAAGQVVYQFKRPFRDGTKPVFRPN